jgi:cation diffusion facilitator CzcD-associated flavoprotein CzcO
MSACDVAVIGAGPYGLSAGAHLRRIKGLDVRVFGEPMGFWRTQMPAGMFLRSAWSASSIAGPQDSFGLDTYKLTSGNHLCAPISLQRFIDYGLWFQRSAVPDVDCRKITRLSRAPAGFRLTLDDGDSFSAPRVLIAAGLAALARRPVPFQGLPGQLASHTSETQDLRHFSGKCVAVIGSGQSALESAALLSEAGAQVELIVRSARVHWLGWKERLQRVKPLFHALFSKDDVGPAGISRIVATPELVRKLPRSIQDGLRRISLQPAGARWLIERLPTVPITTSRSVIAAEPLGGRLQITLDDKTTRVVDHALLGTGYSVDVKRYNFLDPDIIRALQVSNGFPQLGRAFESCVPGLHFIGPAAAWSYGPLMYFVSGTRYTATALSAHFLRNA